MSYENVLVSSETRVAVITINRPNQLNALNRDTIAELGAAFSAIDADPEVRCVIVTGSGEKAFVAGADIKEFADFTPEEGQALSADGHKILFDRVEQMSKPVIAAVNGFALGGGLELAMSAHMRIASDNAKLGLPEVTLGVLPGYGGTQRLPQLVGKGKALEMITTGGMISAEDALQSGLVNQVVPQEELMTTAQKLASKIARNSPVAISGALKAVQAGFTHGVDGKAAEIQEFGNCFGTEDFKEGTTAFLSRAKPDFPGR
jgi:enoyl-CoA hydratase